MFLGEVDNEQTGFINIEGHLPLVTLKLVTEPKLLNIIFSAMKIRLARRI